MITIVQSIYYFQSKFTAIVQSIYCFVPSLSCYTFTNLDIWRVFVTYFPYCVLLHLYQSRCLGVFVTYFPITVYITVFLSLLSGDAPDLHLPRHITTSSWGTPWAVF